MFPNNLLLLVVKLFSFNVNDKVIKKTANSVVRDFGFCVFAVFLIVIITN